MAVYMNEHHVPLLLEMCSLECVCVFVNTIEMLGRPSYHHLEDGEMNLKVVGPFAPLPL